jgi:hypothetical protein
MPVLSTLGAAAARGFGFLGKVAQAIDEYFEYVTMLLPGNGTNGAQNNTFLDSSANNFTITRNGNTTQGTFAPYGANWSNYFDGAGDYLDVANDNTFDTNSTYTLECWFYQPAAGNAMLFNRGGGTGNWSTSNGYQFTLLILSGLLYWQWNNSGSPTGISVTTPTAGAWHHVAIGYNGTTTRVWVDGASIGTSTTAYTLPSTRNIIRVGTDQSTPSSNPLTGYISGLRFVKGTDVYGVGNTTITVPTAPLTAITNTSLLTCQSNRFIDNSANNFTITRNGDVSVQVFSPFSPTASYAAGTNGGSGYFDGSGDYLQAPNNAAFAFGTGNFTLEAWFYAVPPLGNNTILGNLESSADADTVLGFWLTGTGGIEIATWNTFLYQSASNVVVSNQWNHIAICRSGTTDAVWLNGTRLSSWTDTFNYSSTNGYRVGAWGAGSYIYKGYISNARIIKGTAVYNPSSATITVPTAPFSSISGTSLLCNFTNAGVIDNAMMNNLETVGNAQISTTQSKWGGSSIAFDGTGDWLLTQSIPQNAIGPVFTVECWVYLTVGGVVQWICGNNTGSGSTAFVLQIETNRTVYGGTWNNGTQTTAAVSLNTWTHIALVGDGTNYKIYLDGTQSGSAVAVNDITSALPIYIGAQPTGARNFNGYIDDLRITKGFARYTANFTAPTAPFPTR